MNFIQKILLLVTIAAVLSFVSPWKIDRKPKIYGDKVPEKIISTNIRRVQQRIVTLHNFFRTKVHPSASNMLSLRWHTGAAQAAQRWADQCHFLQHDPPSSRTVANFGACGQNIFVSTHKVPWLFALKSWFVERQNFTYGSSNNDLEVVGHYTQMVWAATHKVGCGLTKCSHGGPGGMPFYNYVCDYCPIGNYQKSLGFPYKNGTPCGKCMKSCDKKKRLCTNGCNSVDLWDNCADLYRRWPGWLCNSATPEGIERQNHCSATCNCRGKIYD